MATLLRTKSCADKLDPLVLVQVDPLHGRQVDTAGASMAREARQRSGTRGAPALTHPDDAKTPPERGAYEERLMGLEPTTFCMASRRSSQLSYSRARGRV